MRIYPRSKTKKIAALLLGASALWLIYTVARSKILLDNGRVIKAHSAQFERDLWIGAADAPTLTYLALGDSTAAGWGAGTLAGCYPHILARAVATRGFRVHLINVAVGGARAGDVAASQLAAIGRTNPDLITLSVGANDATHGTAPDAYKRDLSAILTALQESHARAILVANTPDMFQAPALPLPLSLATGRRARAQNEILRGLIENSRFQIVDLFGRGELPGLEFYAADRFHPNAAGYAIWARLFVESYDKTLP